MINGLMGSCMAQKMWYANWTRDGSQSACKGRLLRVKGTYAES